MARYSIEDTVLTNIADAIREKTPKKYKIVGEEVIRTEASRTNNATGFDTYSGTYSNSANWTDEVAILGADEMRVKIAYQTEGASYDYVIITPDVGEPTAKLGGKTLTVEEFTFPGTDTLTFTFKTDGSGNNYLGYYAEVTGIKYIKEELPEDTYTPVEMATAVSDLNVVEDGVGVLTGDVSEFFRKSYATAATSSSKDTFYTRYFKAILPTFITKDITTAKSMFYENIYVKDIPFAINLAEDGARNVICMCTGCTKLAKAPKITGKIQKADELLRGCNNLQDVSEVMNYEFDNSDPKKLQVGYMFGSNYYLRSFPEGFLKKFGRLANPNAGSYCPGYNIGYCQFSLDEMVDFGVTPVTLTVSSHFNVSYQAYRLKRWTFETNEDGTPKTANWHSQLLTFHEYCGYTNGNLMTNYGFLESSRVKDDDTYQANKDNPDYWTTLLAYSRYNHDSAVETINSLPDTSAFLAQNSGKTNTIKFKGTAGSKTDGGAIETLTEEEIAVATAKGWTVTLA